MIKKTLFGLLLGTLLALLGCKNQFYTWISPDKDLTNEHWIQNVPTQPRLWARHADPWFLTGKPNRIEQNARNAPPSAAMTILSVKAPYFKKIEVDGHFQVQIVSQEKNSVMVLGTNASARDVVVENHGNTLFIHTPKDADPAIVNSIIVRIGVRNLQSITNLGDATILGRHISSEGLIVKNCSTGCIMLEGTINLLEATNLGEGTITILGACTPALSVSAIGNGNVYIAGHVGIQSIDHNGDGQVSIIGADTQSLTITTHGKGLTTVYGFVNLKLINAADNSCVYVYWVCNTNGLQICQTGSSRVGIAGKGTVITVDLSEASLFQGHYFHAHDAYVTTRHVAHANINANKEIFATASQNSSIYIEGTSNTVSSHVTENAVILPFQMQAPPLIVPPTYPVYSEDWRSVTGGVPK